jgi:hypothetical protein
MKNQTKHPDYIKIMHLINRSHKISQVESMAELIRRYGQKYNDWGQLWTMAKVRIHEIECEGYGVQEGAARDFCLDENCSKFVAEDFCELQSEK